MADGKAGAPPGNQNAAKGRVWRDAINRAMAIRDKSRADGKRTLDELAGELVELALLKDLGALREIGDRLEGKAAQSMQLSGDSENPLCIIIRGDDAKL